MKSLAVYRKSHTGLRPYSCHICGKAFVRKDIMQEHVRGHDPTKPNYVCQECGMGFARRFSLQAHIFHHNPDNRFKCSLCPKSYLTRSNLRRHEETHAEKQTCPNCNAVVMHLKLHRKTCGTNKTFPCTSCGKVFSQKRYLAQHKLSHETPTYECVGVIKCLNIDHPKIS